MKKIHVTKTRPIVLNIIPISTIPDAQALSSDGCSGLMLFPSQRICQTLHKTEVSSACGYELYFWCALCRSGVLVTRWTQSLVALLKWTLDYFVHDDYECNLFLLLVLVVSLMLTMLLEVRINSVHSIVSHVRWNVFPGRCSVVPKLGTCAVNLLQRSTTTCFSKVSGTTTLDQYG